MTGSQKWTRRSFARVFGSASLFAMTSRSGRTLDVDSAAEASEIATSGTLLYTDRADPGSLDPTMDNNTATQMLGIMTYDTLLAKDYDLKLVPLLATSWKVSPDGKTYTLVLRNDVVFHSGKKMTSADVKYSWDRVRDKQTASPLAYLFDSVDQIATPTPYTVVVNLARPNRMFLDSLSNPGTSILNRDSVERAGKEFGHSIEDGTGPYRLVSRVFNQEIVYERFDGYTWGPNFYSNHGPAHLKRFVWRIVPELATQELMLENGETDLITHHTDPSILNRAAELRGKIEITRRPVTDTRELVLNTRFAPLNDLAVRQAIARGVDRTAIAKSIYAPTGIPAVNILHLLAYGYWKGIERVVPRYDPDKAKQLLDAAGWKLNANGYREKGGIALKNLKLMGLPQYQDPAVAIKETLGEIGISVDIELSERGRLYPLRRAGGVPMEIYNSEGTADTFAEYLLSTNFPGTNGFGWQDPRTDNLIQVFLSSTNERTALDAAAQLQKLVVVDQALSVPIYWTSELNLVNSRTLRDFRGATWLNTAMGKLLDVWSIRTQ